MAKDDTSDLQGILMKVLDFSDADVAANRQGRLSKAQQQRMRDKHHSNARVARVIFSIVFGLGLCGFSAEMIRVGTFGVRSLSLFVGVMVFLGLVVWGFIRYDRCKLRRTLRDGGVQRVEGEIWVLAEWYEKTMVRYLCVGRHRFRIERYIDFASIRESGIEGRKAVAFVSTPWRSLLSVEL